MSQAQLTPDMSSPNPGRWLDEHGDYLFKYASFRLRDDNAAEDAVQETFLAAIKAYAKFEGRGSERTWLVGILKHKITDQFRKSIRESPIGEMPGEDGPEHSEFFERQDSWEGHWNNNYAPSEDAVQETFLAAIKAYAKFEGRGSERTWLVGILKHKITDQFRKSIRESPIGEMPGEDGPEHSEFFERQDSWEGHWNNNYAPS